jgi:hypothetical protein
MDKRRLSKRLFRIAELRERFARIRRGEAARTVREQEALITSLEQEQTAARDSIHGEQGPIDGKWLQALEESRQANKIKRDHADVELHAREKILKEEARVHIKTVDSMRSAEKVKERVIEQWREEQESNERKELDDLGAVHLARHKDE